MSHKIVSKRQVGKDVFWAQVEAPLIAKARKPGQFTTWLKENEASLVYDENVGGFRLKKP